jgi:hypothetical protein
MKRKLKSKTDTKSVNKLKAFLLANNCDSWDEYYFMEWCRELEEAGILLSYSRSESFVLTSEVKEKTLQVKVTKKGNIESIKETILLNGSVYTPDVKLEINFDNPLWVKFFSDTKTIGKIRVEKGRYTYIEVKPDYDMNNMTRLFTNNQKFMFKTHKIYVNLCICSKLFEKTFTPMSYLFHPSGRKKAKLPYTNIKTLNEYLEE